MFKDRLFKDRREAGRLLAERLSLPRGEDAVVLGLTRGGVPVAYEIARALGAPLDVLVVRKLGAPHQPELAFGAIGEHAVRVLNPRISAQLTDAEKADVEAREREELSRRVERLRGPDPPIPLTGRTAIVVDDGIATGATVRVACRVARARGAARVLLAVPVAARDTLATLRDDADEVICLHAPPVFLAVGQWYRHFRQTSDHEVAELLRAAAAETTVPHPVSAADPPPHDEEISFLAETVELTGHLTIPEHPIGLVVFAHGSGSGRHSPRNRYVAEVLEQAGLGTLLFDLLTPAEEAHRDNVFDIALLARRLVDATRTLAERPHTAGLPIGYFGASTGAAAALRAATDPRLDIAAIVSRGGRPDLAGDALNRMRAPTLLIVGGRDPVVLELNRHAQHTLPVDTELRVVHGASHLFTEAGALEQVAELARDWFRTRLAPAPATGRAPS
nr:alpha/beta family hydrolase [Nocardia arthritidis]